LCEAKLALNLAFPPLCLVLRSSWLSKIEVFS
jgi:hypothetical protein